MNGSQGAQHLLLASLAFISRRAVGPRLRAQLACEFPLLVELFAERGCSGLRRSDAGQETRALTGGALRNTRSAGEPPGEETREQAGDDEGGDDGGINVLSMPRAADIGGIQRVARGVEVGGVSCGTRTPSSIASSTTSCAPAR